MNPYLFGDMYSNHPSQTGRSALFLKKPENKKKGSITMGVMALTDLASRTTLPKKRPSEDPLKLIKMQIK